jgi:hypothetical protein
VEIGECSNSPDKLNFRTSANLENSMSKEKKISITGGLGVSGVGSLLALSLVKQVKEEKKATQAASLKKDKEAATPNPTPAPDGRRRR